MALKKAIFVFALLCSLCYISHVAAHGGGGMDGGGGHEEETRLNYFEAGNGAYKAEWIVGDTYINFTITLKTKGWAAIAFSNDTSEGYDVIVGYQNANGTANITDRWMEKGSNIAKLDIEQSNCTNDVEFISVTSVNQQTVMKFSRKLVTLDEQCDYQIKDEELQVKWAFSDVLGDTVGKFEYFDVSTHDIEINFFPLSPKEKKDDSDEMKKIKFHGFLMCTLVMVLITSAIVTARYLKKVVVWWFYLHAVLTVLGWICLISALSLVFKAHDNMFVPSWHSAFGVIFIILISLQTLIGLAAHFKFDKFRREPPMFPDRIHWWLGRLVFALGGINIALGFGILGGYSSTGWFFYVMWILVVAFIFVFLERTIGQTHESVTGHTVITSALEEEEKARAGGKQTKQQRKSSEFLVMFFVPAVTAVS